MAVRANCALDQSINEVSILSIILVVVRVISFCRLIATLYQFARHVFFLGLFSGLTAQITGKKEEFEDKEHDEEFHQNNEPQGTPQSHTSEAFQIEVPYTEQGILHNTEFIVFQK